MRLYGLKNCDTCKKALKELEVAGHNVSLIDVRQDGVSLEKLMEFRDEFGEAIVNKRSTTWRGLSDVEKEMDMIVQLTNHPTLMKRPVIELDDGLYLGWDIDVKQKLLG